MQFPHCKAHHFHVSWKSFLLVALMALTTCCHTKESEAPCETSSGTHTDFNKSLVEKFVLPRPIQCSACFPGQRLEASFTSSGRRWYVGACPGVEQEQLSMQSSWLDDSKQRFSVSLTNAIVNVAWLRRDAE